VKPKVVTVVGAGIAGLWQAYSLSRRGHNVRLVERSAEPFARTASILAGAMLAPDCEAEAAGPRIRDLGLKGLDLWRAAFPGMIANGSLVVAQARDRAELVRFGRLTVGHETADAARIARLEPHLEGRFASGLHFPGEGHMAPEPAMRFLLDAARGAGAEIALGETWTPRDARGIVVDCRGPGARADLPRLRGVRGERLILRTREVVLNRPVRVLHPRFPIYVVPWDDGLFMVGATAIESDDAGPVTVRSALELLATAYALHPAFGEAQIVASGAGIRPAFPDNSPRIIVRGDHMLVNGLYRHGFLLAPVLAEMVAAYLETGERAAEVFE
jgi:glycine oxidase